MKSQSVNFIHVYVEAFAMKSKMLFKIIMMGFMWQNYFKGNF